MRGVMWIRRSVWEATLLDLQTVKRQYGERVALERKNLAALETRYNDLKDQYDDLAKRYDNLLGRSQKVKKEVE